MPVYRLIAVFSILLICGSASAQRWIPYSSPTDGFRLMAPGELDGVYIAVYGQVDVRGSIAFAAKKIRDNEERL